MRVTEIGAFINMQTLPAVLEIRADANGVPGTTVVATFAMSSDNDPLTFSYESVLPGLPLEAGTYFAVFAPQDSDEGGLLGGASVPFIYSAGLTPVGIFDPTTGRSQVSDQFAAVRIIAGESVTARDLLVNLLTVVDAESIGPGQSLHDKLVDAVAYSEAGETEAACESVNAFKNEVDAQAAKPLTAERASAVIADADEITALLGC